MTALSLFWYGVAIAGAVACNLLVLFVFACAWLYLVGKGRE